MLEVVKVTKNRFKEQFYEMMVEFASDHDGMVKIEGIDMMTEYLSLLKKPLVEKDFLPNLQKMLTMAADPIHEDEIRTRMAKLCG